MMRSKTEMAAADWLARQDRGLTLKEALAFERWLAASSGNRVCYLRLRAIWQEAGKLQMLSQTVPMPPPRPLRPPLLRWMSIAAVLLLLMGGALYVARMPWPVTYQTKVGGQQTVMLKDGTRIQLDTDTRIRTVVTAERRTVDIGRGRVYLEVVHDAKRPFVVIAGNHRITDLGTKFAVLRDDNDVQVIVRDGRVRVDALRGASAGLPVFAVRNDVVSIHGGAVTVSAKSPDEIRDDLAWRRGMLVFSREPLARVAAQFNRYNKQQIVVLGAARNIRVGGSFGAHNIVALQSLLRDGFNLSVHEDGNQIVVSQ